jgi:hypothetical protein
MAHNLTPIVNRKFSDLPWVVHLKTPAGTVNRATATIPVNALPFQKFCKVLIESINIFDNTLDEADKGYYFVLDLPQEFSQSTLSGNNNTQIIKFLQISGNPAPTQLFYYGDFFSRYVNFTSSTITVSVVDKDFVPITGLSGFEIVLHFYPMLD